MVRRACSDDLTWMADGRMMCVRLPHLSWLALLVPAAVACTQPFASAPPDSSAPRQAPAASVSEPAARATDVVVLLDVSGSMNAPAATGTRVTRLTWAKEAAATWIASRKVGAVGVILFAEHASVLSPLTLAYDEASRRVRETRVGAVAANATVFGEALVAGARALTNPNHDRVLLLLTDGEHQHPGTDDPIGAARFVRGQGVRIDVVQVGDEEEAEIQSGADIFNKPTYARIKTPRDRALLQLFAAETGGRYALAKDEAELAAAMLAAAR